MKKKFLIDLFSGAGGLSCGLKLAGFTPILANEMVSQYAKTYSLNHKNVNMIVGDIRSIDENDFFNISEKYGDIDLIAGGPPCQGFSVNAPIRTLDDPRNKLFKEYIRVVRAIRPKAVLIENVTGIIQLGKGTVVEQIYKELEELGYKVKHKILFAGHYGIPQLRFRTVFIALRNYNKDILFPEPEYYINGIANFFGAKKYCFKVNDFDRLILKNKITVGDVFSDLPNIDYNNKTGDYDYACEPKNEFQKYLRKKSNSVTQHICSNISKINIERLKYIPQGGSWRDIPYELLPTGMKTAKRSDHTKRYGRLHPDELCSTILTKCDPHWGCFFHPFENRIISIREAARIQSFPDNYIFTGTLSEKYAQIGNAVPPLLAKKIGKKIIEMLGV